MSNSLQFGEQDYNRHILLVDKDTIILKLNENASTGYQWELVKNEGVEICKDTTELRDLDRIGAVGIRKLTLKFKHKGEHNIELKYWRDWEGEDTVVKRFYLKVTVT